MREETISTQEETFFSFSFFSSKEGEHLKKELGHY